MIRADSLVIAIRYGKEQSQLQYIRTYLVVTFIDIMI